MSQFDVESFPKFTEFHHWFEHLGSNQFEIRQIHGKYSEGTVTVVGGDPVIALEPSAEGLFEEILSDFVNFQKRPEYLVTAYPVVDDPQYLYEGLVIGCELLRAFKQINLESAFSYSSPDDEIDGALHAINWLRTTDFYVAPASSRYHDCQRSGLVVHTLKVVSQVRNLLASNAFPGVKLQDGVLCALVHDWCKIGLYEEYMRNVKDSSGRWVQKPEYRYRDRSFTCFGHGVSSMFLAQKFFKLSSSELLAIRWHMGFCRVAESDMNELQQANETYPIVHLLQFADQLSITAYSI